MSVVVGSVHLPLIRAAMFAQDGCGCEYHSVQVCTWGDDCISITAWEALASSEIMAQL